MALKLTVLDLAISERLQPLRDALNESGVLVSTLPKEVGKYSLDDTGAIHLLIPEVSSTGGEDESYGTQTVESKIFLRINLSKRYQDAPNEIDVLEWTVDQAISLLIGFTPEGINCQRPMRFVSYQLFKPEAGQWTADIQFALRHVIRSLNDLPTIPEELLSVEFFSVTRPDFSDPQLVTKFK